MPAGIKSKVTLISISNTYLYNTMEQIQILENSEASQNNSHTYVYNTMKQTQINEEQRTKQK